MKIVREATVTLKNGSTGTAVEREIAILKASNGHFIVINADKLQGWSEASYASKSHMFDNEVVANKWFDKLSKDENL